MTDITCYEPDLHPFEWMGIIVKENKWIPTIVNKNSKALEAAKIKQLRTSATGAAAKAAINKITVVGRAMHGYL